MKTTNRLIAGVCGLVLGLLFVSPGFGFPIMSQDEKDGTKVEKEGASFDPTQKEGTTVQKEDTTLQVKSAEVETTSSTKLESPELTKTEPVETDTQLELTKTEPVETDTQLEAATVSPQLESEQVLR